MSIAFCPKCKARIGEASENVTLSCPKCKHVWVYHEPSWLARKLDDADG